MEKDLLMAQKDKQGRINNWQVHKSFYGRHRERCLDII